MEEPEIEMGGRMYGGNDKSLERLVEDVLKTVIGQDEAVRWICGFLDAASARSRIISERRVDSLSMPRMGSALIVGPTASGKTHMLKTVAKQSGMLFMEIDASAMTAEGYKGASFSSQWVRAAAALGDNPNKNLIVFVDEVDKMFAASQFREVSQYMTCSSRWREALSRAVMEARGNPGSIWIAIAAYLCWRVPLPALRRSSHRG